MSSNGIGSKMLKYLVFVLFFFSISQSNLTSITIHLYFCSLKMLSRIILEHSIIFFPCRSRRTFPHCKRSMPIWRMTSTMRTNNLLRLTPTWKPLRNVLLRWVFIFYDFPKFFPKVTFWFTQFHPPPQKKEKFCLISPFSTLNFHKPVAIMSSP